MKNRFHHIIIQFLIVALAGLGSSQAGSFLCAADCLLCGVPEVTAVSCCDDMAALSHQATGQRMSPGLSAAGASSTGCSHGDLCAKVNYPVEAGLHSTNLSAQVALSLARVDFTGNGPLTRLMPDVELQPPSDKILLPLYIRNCSYLI